MPTVTEIVTAIYPISQYLASDDMAKGALYGSRVNPMLPVQLFVVGKSVKNRYEYEDIAGGSTPSASLKYTSNYLYKLCDKYGLYALSLVNAGGVIPDTGNGSLPGARMPLIGVAGRGGVNDPIVGENSFQSDDLIGLGSTNNGWIQAFMLKIAMDNFEPNPDFTYNPETGEITNLTFVWGEGDTIYVDRNQ